MELRNIPFLNKRIKFPIAPHFPGGLVSAADLHKLADVAEQRGARLKISGNNLILLDIPVADSETVLAELGRPGESFIGSGVRGVGFCPGKGECPRGQQASSELGLALDQQFFGQRAPGKVRIAVSGCPNCCAESFVRDIGLFGLPTGYTLVVGGSSGRRAQIARELLQGLSAEQVPAVITLLLDYYRQNANDKERLGAMLNRIGWDELQQLLLNASASV